MKIKTKIKELMARLKIRILTMYIKFIAGLGWAIGKLVAWWKITRAAFQDGFDSGVEVKVVKQ